MVAINWLLIADASRLGILDPDCIRLAALHSDAVDYPKTGQVSASRSRNCEILNGHQPVARNTIPKFKPKRKPDWHAPEVNVNLGMDSRVPAVVSTHQTCR
jgi:hypothetical protein